MVEALIGLAGIVVGALLGATGTYFRLRRDAWSEARANGLTLLADVRAVLKECKSDEDVSKLLEEGRSEQLIADTRLGVTSWDSRGQTLARFRRGNYPSGLSAPDWLRLAAHFTTLRKLQAPSTPDESLRWNRVRCELKCAEKCLLPFEDDPSVFPYVVVTGLKESWKGFLVLGLAVILITLALVGIVPWVVTISTLGVSVVIVAPALWDWWLRTGRAPSKRSASDAPDERRPCE